MELADHVAAIRAEARRLVAAAERAGPEAVVPSCPGWNVANLLSHVGSAHRWAAANLARRPQDGPRSPRELERRPEDPLERPAWVLAGVEPLVGALEATPTDAPAWTWGPPPVAGFWSRRMAQETALHRVDAQLAAGGPVDALDPPLATDGIDEFLGLLAHHPGAEPVRGAGETLHLHCTDVEGEWLVRLTPDGPEVERVHAKGDVAVRGAASDLLRALVGRADLDQVEVFGDRGLFERFREDSKL